MKKIILSAAATATAISSLAMPAVSEETERKGFTYEEVLVTAQKRSQRLQDIPVAVTVINAQDIVDRKISDISDIGSSVPNVQIATSPGGSTSSTIAIRGSASINPAPNWEPSVSVYMDNVFISKAAGSVFDVAEMSSIEVLRGPQSTFGKNSVGGSVNLITRKPHEEFGVKAKVGTGNYGYTEFQGTLDSGKLADIASFMLSYSKRDRAGFYNNTADNAKIDKFKKLDSEAVMLKVNVDATDRLNLVYAADYSKRDNTVSLGQQETLDANGNLPKPNRAGSASISGAGAEQSEVSGHSLTVTYDISDDLVFKSITAYRAMTFNDYNDYDGAFYAIPSFEAERDIKHHQTSQEFQFIGTTERFNYVGGLFYFTDSVAVENPYHKDYGTPFTVRNFYGVTSESYAAYGQADWLATDYLTLTLGGRFTQEEKESYVSHPDVNYGSQNEVVAPYEQNDAKESWGNFSPMIAISYAASDDLTIYAKANKGFKSGGFNGESGTIEDARKPYKEETTTGYEVGVKASTEDRRISYNLAIFQNHINNMQLSAYDESTGYSKIENAGEALITGLELEVQMAITEYLTAYVNYGFMKAKYKNFLDPLTGEQKKDVALFAYTPESKTGIGIEYLYPFNFAELKINADFSHTGEQVFYRQYNSANVTKSPAYLLLNGRISLADIKLGGDQTLDLGLWGKNITGESYRVNGIPGFGAINAAADGINYYGDPRTFGIDATYTF